MSYPDNPEFLDMDDLFQFSPDPYQNDTAGPIDPVDNDNDFLMPYVPDSNSLEDAIANSGFTDGTFNADAFYSQTNWDAVPDYLAPAPDANFDLASALRPPVPNDEDEFSIDPGLAFAIENQHNNLPDLDFSGPDADPFAELDASGAANGVTANTMNQIDPSFFPGLALTPGVQNNPSKAEGTDDQNALAAQNLDPRLGLIFNCSPNDWRATASYIDYILSKPSIANISKSPPEQPEAPDVSHQNSLQSDVNIEGQAPAVKNKPKPQASHASPAAFTVNAATSTDGTAPSASQVTTHRRTNRRTPNKTTTPTLPSPMKTITSRKGQKSSSDVATPSPADDSASSTTTRRTPPAPAKKRVNKHKNLPPRTQIYTKKLLIRDLATATHYAVKYTQLTVANDDRDLVAADPGFWITTLAKAFDAPFKELPEDIANRTPARLAEWTRWQTEHEDKTWALLAEHDDPRLMAQSCARIFFEQVLEAHEPGRGLKEVAKTIANGGADLNMTCSQRLAAAIGALGHFTIARYDLLKLERLDALAASPDGFVSRKVSNMWLNFKRKDPGEAAGGKGKKRAAPAVESDDDEDGPGAGGDTALTESPMKKVKTEGNATPKSRRKK